MFSLQKHHFYTHDFVFISLEAMDHLKGYGWPKSKSSTLPWLWSIELFTPDFLVCRGGMMCFLRPPVLPLSLSCCTQVFALCSRTDSEMWKAADNAWAMGSSLSVMSSGPSYKCRRNGGENGKNGSIKFNLEKRESKPNVVNGVCVCVHKYTYMYLFIYTISMNLVTFQVTGSHWGC